MTLFFPDLNVWLALSVAGHVHNPAPWGWLSRQPADRKLIFSRYTQLGLLRLLTNSAVMGDAAPTLRKASGVYDRWLEDPRVEFYPEPRDRDAASREITKPFASQQTSKGGRRLLPAGERNPASGYAGHLRPCAR
jgi:predicted nucleic acid-binding protein